MRIDAKAPTRVDLAGGTLDIWPLYLFHPGAVTINAAISRYAYCVIDSNVAGDDRIKLVSLDTNCSESFASFEKLVHGRHYKLPLLAEIVKFFKPKGGFSLTTNSEAPAGAGIGGSSAMAVAICAALDRYTSTGRSKVDWIHISRDAEAIVIDIPTGMQDHYPPAFGGAAAIELMPGGERRVELNVNLDELRDASWFAIRASRVNLPLTIGPCLRRTSITRARSRPTWNVSPKLPRRCGSHSNPETGKRADGS